MTVATFDPQSFAVSVDGNLIGGLAGTFIEAVRDNPQVNELQGGVGNLLRVKTGDRRGTITLTLLQDSPSNAILTALMNADAVPGEDKIFALNLQDTQNPNTGDNLFADEAWISTPPTVTRSVDGNEQAWEIKCGNLQMVLNGVAA